ncbi:hypothetical protein PTKIN_Ptkin16aG0023900 [Pterospermum kingtungense]
MALEDISNGLSFYGFQVQVCPMGGLSVLVKFPSIEDRVSFISGPSPSHQWFNEFYPWNISLKRSPTNSDDMDHLQEDILIHVHTYGGCVEYSQNLSEAKLVGIDLQMASNAAFMVSRHLTNVTTGVSEDNYSTVPDSILGWANVDTSLANKYCDIENRNRVILEEAETNWDVSSAVGFNYARNRVLMIEVFSTLEEDVQRDGNSGGLISCWKEEFFSLESKICSQRFIVLIGTIKELNLRCAICNVYALNDDADRLSLWQELSSIISGCNLLWCIGGDFNVIRDESEKIGLSYNAAPMNSFSSFIDNVGLLDLPLHGGMFTWSSNGETPTFCWLDIFLISSNLLIDFPRLLQKVWPN